MFSRIKKKGKFAFLSEKTFLSLKKAKGVGGAARPPFAHLAAAPQALQAGIEVRCMTNYIFFAFKHLKRFCVAFFFLCGRSLCVHVFAAKRGVCLLVGEDISCVIQ